MCTGTLEDQGYHQHWMTLSSSVFLLYPLLASGYRNPDFPCSFDTWDFHLRTYVSALQKFKFHKTKNEVGFYFSNSFSIQFTDFSQSGALRYRSWRCVRQAGWRKVCSSDGFLLWLCPWRLFHKPPILILNTYSSLWHLHITLRFPFINNHHHQ